MAGVEVAHAYRYAQPSGLVRRSGGRHLHLVTDVGAGQPRNPWFFEGRVASPRVLARLLVTVADVARARYWTPPSMLARILAVADPIVTSARDRLRFESLSACCSVYARLDALPGSMEVETQHFGTTNVDVGPKLRAALTGVRGNEALMLEVAADQLQVTRGAGSFVERKVALPVRWLKGLVEVQAYQSRMKPVVTVSGNEARRFLRALPRQRTGHTPAWVLPAGRGLRLSFSPAVGGIPLVGLERLRPLDVAAADAHTLRVFSLDSCSAWVLDFDDLRLTLAISPEPMRGFSGEGQVLAALGDKTTDATHARIKAALSWDPVIDAAALGRKVGRPLREVTKSLAALGTRGLVGFDVSEGAYYARALPFDLGAVDRLHPRLRSAQKLVDTGAVRLGGRGAQVTSGDVVHRVRRSADGLRTCTCPWYGRHRGDRGPCKHVLAVEMVEELAAARDQ